MHNSRKIKDPCLDCYLHKDRCICQEIPSLALRTKISLVIHAKEVVKSTNTGRLAIKSLINSEMIIRGESRTPLDLSKIIDPNYQTYLLFPTENALELNHELVASGLKPFHLIVPDGSWRQSKKIHTRHPELNTIPRLKLSSFTQENNFLRNPPNPSAMGTLQAIAYALGLIEGENVKSSLLQVYKRKWEESFRGGGKSS
ncbi:MAG: DTW domain-containing protein [Bacteriovoracaceae bacterium]|nr:DTW domain-containing protein [Bacteriovoracaceae bacterium]